MIRLWIDIIIALSSLFPEFPLRLLSPLFLQFIAGSFLPDTHLSLPQALLGYPVLDAEEPFSRINESIHSDVKQPKERFHCNENSKAVRIERWNFN